MAPSERSLRPLLVDLGLLLAIAAGLVGLHYGVPAGVRDGFALRYAAPDPFHAFTAAYVHLTDAHLWSNVAGFLVAGGIGGWLTHQAGQHRWFRLSLLGCLTVLPMTVGMTTATALEAAVVGRGFSGVVAGLVGVVLVSPGIAFREGFGLPVWVGWNAVGVVTFLAAGAIVYIQHGTIPYVVGGVLAVGLVLLLGTFVRRAGELREQLADDGRPLLAAAVVMVVVLATVAAFVVGLFPAEIVGENGVTNVLAHYLGLVGGAVIGAWGSRYWAVPRAGNRRS